MNKVLVTGVGFVSSIGVGREEVLSSLKELRHGFALQQLPGDGIGPELVCGKVDGFDFGGSESRDWLFPARMNWTRLFSAACLHMVPLPWLLWKRRWIRPLWIEQILGMGEPGFFVPRPVLHV